MPPAFDPNNAFQELADSVMSLDKGIVLDAATSALIIIDMQVDYCAPDGLFATQLGADVSPNQEIIRPLTEFADSFRAAGGLVIFTRMIEIPELMPENLARKINSFEEPTRLCDPSTPGFDYFGIKPQAGDIEVIKNAYNSFLSPESHSILTKAGFETPLLDDVLREAAIKTPVFTGVLTARCVQTSLLGSIDRGYFPIVPFDLVSMPAGDLRVRHLSALAEMATMFADVTHSSKISFK